MSRRGWLVGLLVALACAEGVARAAAPPVPWTPAARVEQRLRQAGQLSARGQYATASELYLQALRIQEELYPEKKFPRGHASLARTLHALGWVSWRKGETDKAQGYYERALAMREKLYPKGHADLAQTLHNLGLLYGGKREHGKALAFYQRALAMREKLYPEKTHPRGHSSLAGSLHQMGVAYSGLREDGKAQSCYERALAMWEKLYPEKTHPRGHADLAQTLNNLGWVLQKQKAYERALGYHERALAMRQRLFPQKDNGKPNTAVTQSMVNLAETCFQLGQTYADRTEYPEAQTYHERALALRLKLYPEKLQPQGHADLARSLYRMGWVHLNKGEFDQAQVYYERSLAMRRKLYPEKRFPDGHIDIAWNLYQLGWVHRNKNEFGQALAYHEQALAMRRKLYPEKRFPAGHAALADSLDGIGWVHVGNGDYSKALTSFTQALHIYEKLYPANRYPNGHRRLASALHSLGRVHQWRGEYNQSLDYLERARAMFEKLYPEKDFPNGQSDLAMTLERIGGVYAAQGEYAKAIRYHQQALTMFERLYPPKSYPHGHPDLAQSLDHLGGVWSSQGEFAKALPYHERALAMRRQLFPAKSYPNGHKHLYWSFGNLGACYLGQGQYAKALPWYEQALAMTRKLYPVKSYPKGHPDIAGSLTDLGLVSDRKGDFAGALAAYKESLAMYRELYPEKSYPKGHPDLAVAFNNVGAGLEQTGKLAEAVSWYERALKMGRDLYPKKNYPKGHSSLILYLANLGRTFLLLGENRKALPYLEEAVEMSQNLFEHFAAGASEAEALNHAATLLGPQHAYLSVTSRLDSPAGPVCDRLWRSKAGLTQLQQRRREELANADPKSREVADKLRIKRQELSRLLLTPATTPGFDPEKVRQLTAEKEELERKLSALLPGLGRQRQADRLGPAGLAKVMPADAALVDLHCYYHLEANKPAASWAWHYTAFIVRRGQPVRRVGLGRAEPIVSALQAWREAITATEQGAKTAARATEMADRLGRLLWQPLRLALGDSKVVWIAPDGALASLPWAALPGRKPGTVLLEDLAVAVVPNPPFLLEQLLADADKTPRKTGGLLALGGVDYDKTAGAGPAVAMRGPALRDGESLHWTALPATDPERERIVALCEKAGLKSVSLSGKDASTARLLEELPAARFAHLATHGFLADERFRSVLRVDPRAFRWGTADLSSPGVRNPLVLSGLVLAVANHPASAAGADHGILTAEAIAGLSLERLELAVLSACDTGRGTLAGGEGVFGLQRAFHLAGARNVIASLWRVEDNATAALMGLFYRNLWVVKMPPIEALRQAQLFLYRHPEQIATLARMRGPDFAHPQKLPGGAKEKPAAGTARARVNQWAAFVLSGSGR